MIFTLEAVQAGTGDSFILHFGPPDAPRFIVIDGGPAGIYDQWLGPRLQDLQRRWKHPEDDKLDLEMVMVSHIDEDHIQGILDLVGELEREASPHYNILTLWHNSFDDLVGNSVDELRSKLQPATTAALASGLPSDGLQPFSAAVLASVKQGRDLRVSARRLGIPLNRGFGGLVSALPGGAASLNVGSGLTFRVISPTMKRLEALSKEWEKLVRKLDKAGTAELAAFADRSVSNLSSIAVLAEAAGKRILLTGDARGDHLLDGLTDANLLQNGKLHVNLFKVPHHGSSRNATPELFQKITADHYVISANGEYGNPEPEVINWITQARGSDPYTLHLTNQQMTDPKTQKDVGAAIRQALDDHPAANRKIEYGGAKSPCLLVDLDEKVDY